MGTSEFLQAHLGLIGLVPVALLPGFFISIDKNHALKRYKTRGIIFKMNKSSLKLPEFWVVQKRTKRAKSSSLNIGVI